MMGLNTPQPCQQQEISRKFQRFGPISNRRIAAMTPARNIEPPNPCRADRYGKNQHQAKHREQCATPQNAKHQANTGDQLEPWHAVCHPRIQRRTDHAVVRHINQKAIQADTENFQPATVRKPTSKHYPQDQRDDFFGFRRHREIAAQDGNTDPQSIWRCISYPIKRAPCSGVAPRPRDCAKRIRFRPWYRPPTRRGTWR